MKLCRTRLLVVLTFLAGPTLAVTSVRANLHHPAALPCQRNCPGLIRWTVFNRLDDILAQCDKRSCSSKEGFNISHDQYLNGDLTLSISAADYTKRTKYICWCKWIVVCEVRLSIERLISSVQKHPGEDVLLDLPISDPVELIYNSSKSEGSSGHRICMVEEAVLRCNSEYNQRASLNHTFINLREVTLNDSGVYIIQDIQYEEIIHLYTVTVKVNQRKNKKDGVPPWAIFLLVMFALLPVLALLDEQIRRVLTTYFRIWE